MELKQYGAILRRWLWLILLATGIAAGTSYLATRQMPKVYQASTTLMVGQTLQNPNPTTGLLNISQQLAQTYAQIATPAPVLQSALDDLEIQVPVDRWRDQINARTIPGTSLIEIRVVDSDPLRAQALANGLGNQLITQSPAGSEQSDSQRGFVQNQMKELEFNIEQAQLEIKQQSSISSTGDSQKEEDKQKQIDALQNQISTWQQTYASFLDYVAPRAANYISVIDPAHFPDKPIAPNVPVYVLSSGAIGMLLAICGIFIIGHVEKAKKE